MTERRLICFSKTKLVERVRFLSGVFFFFFFTTARAASNNNLRGLVVPDGALEDDETHIDEPIDIILANGGVQVHCMYEFIKVRRTLRLRRISKRIRNKRQQQYVCLLAFLGLRKGSDTIWCGFKN